MRLSHTLEYYALILFARILCILPLRLALGIGSAIGALGWSLGIRRDLVLANVKRARPEASEKEREQIASQAAKNFGRTIVEFIRYGIKDRDQVTSIVRVEGVERIQKALAEGKGAIVLTGHQGAWAIYFAAVAMNGVPLSLLVGKQHNERVDAFIHKIPGNVVEFISKGRTAIRVILQKLTEGRAVVIVADQHAGKGGIKVPFLGEVCSTLALPGSLAVKHGAPVFIMEGHREPDGSHLVTLSELEPRETATPDEQKAEIMRRYNEVMGNIVSERPEQYFWYHRRWRPEDTAS